MQINKNNTFDNQIIVNFLNEKFEEETKNDTNVYGRKAKFKFHRLIKKDMEYFQIKLTPFSTFSISYKKNYSVFHKKIKKIFLELVELLKENKRNDLIKEINFIETNIKTDFVEGTEIHNFLQQSLYDIEFKNNEFETLLNNKFSFEENMYYSLAVLENKNGRVEEKLILVDHQKGQYPFITCDANSILATLCYIFELLRKEKEKENKKYEYEGDQK